jgi:micrococcal nuclease
MVSLLFTARPRSALISVLALFGLVALGSWTSLARAESVSYRAKVSYVFDGDTLWVRPSDGGRTRKLRIEGIDAPEICQTGGVAARNALRQRLSGQVVTVSEHSHDTYGRPLVSVTQGSEDVAGWMVAQGWAWSYRWRGDPGPYSRQERQARTRQRGIFASPDAEEPRVFRRRHGPCNRR